MAQTQKDHELASIYAAYQEALRQSDLADREGEGWLALEAVEGHTQLASDVDLLLIDGYDQFTPVQAALVAQLSRRVGEVRITLTGLPAEVQRVGLRFQQALEQLQAAHEVIGASLVVEPLPLDRARQGRPDDLLHLAQQLFANQNAPIQPQQPGTINLIEAPEPAEETAAVLRAAKGLLLQNQATPDDIIVIVRDWERYHTHIETYMRLYDVPALRHHAQPLGDNPAIVALMRLLQLANPQQPQKAFRRRDVLDVLRSPYMRVPGFEDPAMVELLDRISRKKSVLSGWREWEVALEPGGKDLSEGQDGEEEPLATDEELSELSLSLEAFIGEVNPPASDTVENYVAWVDGLIGPDLYDDGDKDELYNAAEPEPHHFAMLHCIRDGAAEHLVRRDVAAIHSLKRLMRGFLETESLLASMGIAARIVTWGAFLTDLQVAIKNALPESGQANRSGRILMTSATEARGLPHQHVFILGMAEGVFPMPASEDPLYLDNERRDLSARGVVLRPSDERTDDDGLFYELMNLAQGTLTLSRPTVRDGKAWNPSHLWRRVCDAFVPESLPLTRYTVGETIPVQESATLDEAMLAAVSDESQQSVRAFLAQHHSDLWQQVTHNIAVEQGRQSRQPHDAYTGKLSHPALVAHVQSELGPNRRWSASQLNEYGTCPFRFFASRFLKLEALEDPEEGMDALQLGSLNHAIMERTYRQLMRDGISIGPDAAACDEALDILQECAQECFASAPQAYNFRPTARWQQNQQVILRRLQMMVRLDFSEIAPLSGPRIPYDMELNFGFKGSQQVTIPINEEERIYVRGSIDRVDRIGDTLYVIDYKSGSTGIPVKEMETGRNFQMMVYLLALDEMLRQRGDTHLRVGGGFFWHIRNQKNSGKFDIDADVSVFDMPEIESARQHLTRHLRNARQGDFREQPSNAQNGRCTSYCDFYQLCRLSVTNQHKHA